MRIYCAAVSLGIIALLLSPGTGCSFQPNLQIIGLGGLAVGSDAQKLEFPDGSFQKLQGQDALGVECRLSQFLRDSFLAVSYKPCGFLDLREGPDSESRLVLHSQVLELCAGRNLNAGRATFSVGVGYAYIMDEFSVSVPGGLHTRHIEHNAGFVLGARLSAPVTISISVLWDYELLIRPSVDYLGEFPYRGSYRIVQGSLHHFMLVGVAVRVI